MHSKKLHDVIFDENCHQEVSMGRPRLLTTRDELGLALFYLRSSMNLNDFYQLFGITPSRCSAIIARLMRETFHQTKKG
jgi:hypothetical protein